jgi:hypothetical protein
MLKYWLILVVFVVVAIYCLYATVFFAWLTATPVTPERLRHAQIAYQVWFGGFVTSSLFLCAVVLLMYRRWRRFPSSPSLQTTKT